MLCRNCRQHLPCQKPCQRLGSSRVVSLECMSFSPNSVKHVRRRVVDNWGRLTKKEKNKNKKR
ncbi:hypothetical protein Hanom_Chr06g00493061 [Helianthus anomalus]